MRRFCSAESDRLPTQAQAVLQSPACATLHTTRVSQTHSTLPRTLSALCRPAELSLQEQLLLLPRGGCCVPKNAPAEVRSRQKAQLASVLLRHPDQALALLGVRAYVLAELLDDCNAASRETRQRRAAAAAAERCAPCECSEMAFPRIWLNCFCPSAFLTTTTMGEKRPPCWGLAIMRVTSLAGGRLQPARSMLSYISHVLSARHLAIVTASLLWPGLRAQDPVRSPVLVPCRRCRPREVAGWGCHCSAAVLAAKLFAAGALHEGCHCRCWLLH